MVASVAAGTRSCSLSRTAGLSCYYEPPNSPTSTYYGYHGERSFFTSAGKPLSAIEISLVLGLRQGLFCTPKSKKLQSPRQRSRLPAPCRSGEGLMPTKAHTVDGLGNTLEGNTYALYFEHIVQRDPKQQTVHRPDHRTLRTAPSRTEHPVPRRCCAVGYGMAW